jgi:hypothetical protein
MRESDREQDRRPPQVSEDERPAGRFRTHELDCEPEAEEQAEDRIEGTVRQELNGNAETVGRSFPVHNQHAEQSEPSDDVE